MGSVGMRRDTSSSADPSDAAPSAHLATAGLISLENHDQRRFRETVSQLRKCELESKFFTPQFVLCGDQYAGKTSVLEALTGIPFPRKDDQGTRYPTEINIRPAPVNSMQIQVIPDPQRPEAEQAAIKNPRQTIFDFNQIPQVMEKATRQMAADCVSSGKPVRRTYGRDVLSIDIAGPNRPRLTIVDLPGIIPAKRTDVSKIDVDLAVEIAESYISQPQAICLAVVSVPSNYDYANQSILDRVRHFDPKGERTLGIITKADRIPQGSTVEFKFAQLARNEDIFFKLGWHVLKNQGCEVAGFSIKERIASETAFFQKSLFGKLPTKQVGIVALVDRLSRLLLTHIQTEIPRLQQDLEVARREAMQELETTGVSRATPEECRTVLSQLGFGFYEVCKAAIHGHYEGAYFQPDPNGFSTKRPETTRRLRAAIKSMNQSFAQEMRENGHKYHIQGIGADPFRPPPAGNCGVGADSELPLLAEPPRDEVSDPFRGISRPQRVSRIKAIEWVSNAVTRTRGHDLPGNFNPLVISELFWEQSSKWHLFAQAHIKQISSVCRSFLEDLLRQKAPQDIFYRVWPRIMDEIRARESHAMKELDKIWTDTTSYVINYSHDYSDSIKKSQSERRKGLMPDYISRATRVHSYPSYTDPSATSIDGDRVLNMYHDQINSDIDTQSSEEVLGCVIAIYRIYRKQFVANVTVQVIERHIVRDLEHVLSPLMLSKLSDSETLKLASEPVTTERRREFLQDRLAKLKEGGDIMQEMLITI